MKFLLYGAALILIIACGQQVIVEKGGKDKPEPPKEELSEEVQGLIDDHCGSCHADGGSQKPIDSVARLEKSQPRIANDSMPPGGGLSDEVKEQLKL